MLAFDQKISTITPLSNKINHHHNTDFHGAAIINQLGQEIAITENMIEQACQQYLQDASITSISLV
jgi:hypothetical protein